MEDDGPRCTGARGGLVVVESDGVKVGGGGASDVGGLLSLDSTWLLVGVVSWGVMPCGPSSSEEESSPRFSSCS